MGRRAGERRLFATRDCRRWVRTRSWLGFGALVGLVWLLGPGSVATVEAHAFLVRTSPAQGERLDEPPDEVSLEFSEGFDERTARLEVAVDEERVSVVPEVVGGGRVLRADLATGADGVYVVSWEVTAEDGHQTAGEFAFGVGAEAGDLPAARDVSPSPSPVRVAAGGLFFVGLALAAGILAAVWSGASQQRRWVMGLGLGLAQVGTLVGWVDALVTDEPVRQRVLLAVAAGAVAVAFLLARLPRLLPVTVAVGAAAMAWSARGHGAVINGSVGGVIDAVHLAAGATWVGALTVLVLDLRRERRETDILSIARRYARLAVGLVAVLAVTGLGSAVLLLDRVSDLWSTGYGRTLVVKTGLVAIAVALAVAGRRALSRRRTDRLRQVTPIEAGTLVAVLGVTALLVNLAPPAASTADAGPAVLGPAPLTGPVVRDAGLAGNLTVAVAAGDGQLQVEVLAPDGRAAPDAQVDLEAELPDGQRTTLLPRPCGEGCFAQRLDLPAGTTRLEVTASAEDWPSGLHVAELTAPPPQEDPALLTELKDRMQAVPTLSFSEATTSGPGSVVAPGKYSLSGSDFVELEPWAAGTAADIRPLDGEAGFRMYFPGDRIWITVWLDDEGRITRERIVNVGHEIERDSFRYPTG